MKTKIALFLGLLLAANVSYADLKIGFVNIPAVLEKAPQAEKAKKRLEQEFSPRDKQLVAQQKEIQALEEKREALQARVSQSGEEGYLEKEARESFNLKKPGEEVVKILPLEEKKEKSGEEKQWWNPFSW